TMDDGVPKPDSVVVQANDRIESYGGALERRPGLWLSGGDYSVHVAAKVADQVIAEASPLSAHVDERSMTEVSVRLRGTPSTGGSDAGGLADAPLESGDAGGPTDGPSASRGVLEGGAEDADAPKDRSLDHEADEDVGHDANDAWPPPVCNQGDAAARPLMTIFTDGFETYPAGMPYDPPGTPWIRANIGRDAVIGTAWSHGGAQSLMLSSYTTRSEVAYVRLPISSAPRRLVIELWYAPDGFYVYEDFAEFGIGFAASKFDLVPSLAFNVHGHRLTASNHPGKPTTDGGDHEGVVLFDEFEYGVSPFVGSYVRLELDFCAGRLDAFVGPDASAPLRSSATFDVGQSFNGFYLAGGLNPTYVDDIAIKVEQGP
ncbi:MAG TPA: hypothetical protein VKT80_07120, partial [Chloroflexota bacterium]|nr:hypothetical protein [Chloroflexota bacterium]